MIFGNPYLWDKYFKKLNQYKLMKNGVYYDIIAHKSRHKLDLVITNQDKRLISTNKKFMIAMIRLKEIGGILSIMGKISTLRKNDQ